MAPTIIFIIVASGVRVGASTFQCREKPKIPCTTLASGESMPLVQLGSWGGSAGTCTIGNFSCLRAYTTSSFQRWFELGGRGIDTANDYKDQVTIGQLLPATGIPRNEIFITTKCPGTIGYEAMIQCVDDNMQMLNLLGDEGKDVNGYIDLVLIHFPFKTPLACRFKDIDACTEMFAPLPTTKEDVQSSWRALEDLKKLGAVKSIGVSSYSQTHLEWTLDIATEPIDVNQINWNPLVHDDDVLAFCKTKGIQVQAWSPLGGSAAFNKVFGIQGSLLTYQVIKEIAAKHGVSTAQVILRWSLQQGVAITTSSNNPSHQKADFELWNFELTEPEMEAISAISSSPAAKAYQALADPEASTDTKTLYM